MRVSPVVSVALILFISGSAFAQDYVEYKSQQDRFTNNFPGDPKITDTVFVSQFGHRLPARVYSVELARNHRFSVTVVDYSRITELGLEKQKACPPRLRGLSRRLRCARKFDWAGVLESRQGRCDHLRDVAVPAARRESDASAVDEHQSRRRTPDSSAEQRG